MILKKLSKRTFPLLLKYNNIFFQSTKMSDQKVQMIKKHTLNT